MICLCKVFIYWIIYRDNICDVFIIGRKGKIIKYYKLIDCFIDDYDDGFICINKC